MPEETPAMAPIRWPDRYAPDRVDAHISNEISIAAAPETVWAWLIRAVEWPQWYPNSHDVKIAGGRRDLGPGTKFTWRTFGVRIGSTVQEFVPGSRIAWDGRGLMLDVYHAWLIETRPGGSWVLTEETQNGLAARTQAALLPNRMYRGHQLWLTSLKALAETGMPG
jgi:uncharacterized protein YndB with AHSA1/START domain